MTSPHGDLSGFMRKTGYSPLRTQRCKTCVISLVPQQCSWWVKFSQHKVRLTAYTKPSVDSHKKTRYGKKTNSTVEMICCFLHHAAPNRWHFSQHCPSASAKRRTVPFLINFENKFHFDKKIKTCKWWMVS